jgi:hypothetical protein
MKPPLKQKKIAPHLITTASVCQNGPSRILSHLSYFKTPSRLGYFFLFTIIFCLRPIPRIFLQTFFFGNHCAVGPRRKEAGYFQLGVALLLKRVYQKDGY